MTDDKMELISKPGEASWYIIHTYSGYENKVKASLENAIENRHLEEYIFNIVVPTEEYTEIKDGKKKTTTKKLYTGYVLINMIMNEETWYVVRNVRGVTGFVGPESKAVTLTEEEVAKMGVYTGTITVDYQIGDQVRVLGGPFADFIGTVTVINNETNEVTVVISMFGRETPINLEMTQIQLLKDLR